MADSFLVLVPHKTLHDTISILIQRPKLAPLMSTISPIPDSAEEDPTFQRLTQAGWTLLRYQATRRALEHETYASDFHM